MATLSPKNTARSCVPMNYKHVRHRFVHGGWTLTVPTKPNTIWWAFGWPFGHHYESEPQLMLIEVRKTLDGKLYYPCQGQLFHPDDESVECLYKRVKIKLPHLPNYIHNHQ